MTDLVDDLAHHLRNPVNSAKLQLELAARRVRRSSDDPSLLDPIDRAREEIDRLGKLLDEILVRPGTPTEAATVLVVDDNAENRALAHATLEDEGFRVVLASGGEAGVAAFDLERPDCVLLDVRMPNVDGPAACRRMRALPRGADVPILFVTALRDVETFDRALSAGGDDFLTKPVRPNELVARVRAALKLRRLAAERSELYAEVKQQRDDLQRLQLQKEQLVAFVVHDLKNPVNAIGLHAELVLRDPEGSARAKRAASQIRDEGRSLLRLITTLLDIAKADAGQLAPIVERVELDALTAEVIAELEDRAALGGVRLVRRIEAPIASCDREVMRRVVENLVENAIRHAPEHSDVAIVTRAARGGIEIAVQDAGSGIPAEKRDRVFERFVSDDATRTNRGLGLAFCKLAVEAHGGRIWIEDRAPGAAFCIWLADAD